ncbi:alpha/beta fold hydrolase [Flavihumibacter petaseus]|uniref:AB hydrolase-1 domain-containing protein n=1 Tax=Flavihumibacter petaseus NBRC 106054 TaxID=1220578 RepID=A0A0E9N6E3_9BACT|nr:alpha/beta hydrolase [Flavihumibacter petaseus]GAO45363.1 hypothetical protein FPE01S_05_00600 [Flavihumibacter petaseus NBRC 106054]
MKKNFFSLSFVWMLYYLCSCGNSHTGKTTKTDNQPVPEVKSVFINGDSIHYIDIGKGDPVVFIHGGLGDYRTWHSQMAPFANSHRVIAYSRRFAYPNQQTANDTTEYTVVANSQDLTALLKALNLPPAHLVGHSYGAFTALQTTLDHPELVRSLTLGEAPVMPLLQQVSGGDTIAGNFARDAFMPAIEAFKSNDQEKAVISFVNGVMGDNTYFAKLSPESKKIIMDNIPEFKGVMFIQQPFPQVTCDDLKTIKAPVLLVTGEKSPHFFIAITDELERCLANRERVSLPNTSHGLEYENPAAFNKAVLTFIDKH